jgi:hypothetical protein
MSFTKCQQRAALFETYRTSTDVYSDLTKRLLGALEADYALAHERVELARQKMIAAREKLNLHMAAHRCLE